MSVQMGLPQPGLAWYLGPGINSHHPSLVDLVAPGLAVWGLTAGCVGQAVYEPVDPLMYDWGLQMVPAGAPYLPGPGSGGQPSLPSASAPSDSDDDDDDSSSSSFLGLTSCRVQGCILPSFFGCLGFVNGHLDSIEVHPLAESCLNWTLFEMCFGLVCMCSSLWQPHCPRGCHGIS